MQLWGKLGTDGGQWPRQSCRGGGKADSCAGQSTLSLEQMVGPGHPSRGCRRRQPATFKGAGASGGRQQRHVFPQPSVNFSAQLICSGKAVIEARGRVKQGQFWLVAGPAGAAAHEARLTYLLTVLPRLPHKLQVHTYRYRRATPSPPSADAVLPLMTAHRSGGRGASPKLGGRPQVGSKRGRAQIPSARQTTSPRVSGQAGASFSSPRSVVVDRERNAWLMWCLQVPLTPASPLTVRRQSHLRSWCRSCYAGRCPQVWRRSCLKVAHAAVQ